MITILVAAIGIGIIAAIQWGLFYSDPSPIALGGSIVSSLMFVVTFCVGLKILK